MSAKPIFNERREQTPQISIAETAILCAVMITGIVFSIFPVLNLTIRTRAIIISVLIAIIFIFAAADFLIRAKRNYWLLSALMADLAIFFFMGSEQWLNGLKLFLNSYISAWNNCYEDGVRLFSADSTQTWHLALFLLSVLLFLAPVLWHLIRHRVFFFMEGLILLLYLPHLAVKSFSPFGAVLILSSIVGFWLFSFQAGSLSRRFLWTSCVMGALFLILALSGLRTSQPVIRVRTRGVELLGDMIYGKDTLPKGDLYQAAGMEEGDEVRLTVSTGQVKSAYLRGYTGAEYTNGKWEPLKKYAYGGDHFGFLKWLKKQGFDPNAQFSSYIQAQNTTLPEVERLEANTMTVTNRSADSRYAYIPYSAVAPNITAIRDNLDDGYVGLTILGARKYQISEYSSNLPGELQRLGAWIYDPQNDQQKQYLENEAVYRSFVHENYLSVDDAYAPLIDSLFHESDDRDLVDHMGVYEAAKRIRSILETNTRYSSEKAVLSQDTQDQEDLLAAFLLGHHAGNSAYYASAAVMAFRSFDIPARYAEGYYLSSRQIETAGQDAVSLHSSDSHAWAEVYMDGMGWVPVDATPGFYFDTYALLQMAQVPGEIQKTAALEDNGEEADQPDSLSSGRRILSQTVEQLKFIGNVLEGILLIMCLFTALLILALEIRHLFEERRILGLLDTPPDRRADLLFKNIRRTLLLFGLEVNPGWNCQETEAVLSRILAEYPPGFYIRVNELMEKYYYGGEELTEPEFRLLHRFLLTLRQNKKLLKMHDRFRLRYGI